jgi:hypothetical protein
LSGKGAQQDEYHPQSGPSETYCRKSRARRGTAR